MSKAYREAFGKQKKVDRDALRAFLRPRFEYEADGITPVYVTEQDHLDECDVNQIIKKYNAGEVITHICEFEHFYGDMSGDDFKLMMDTTLAARDKFMTLPSDIRQRFENNPEQLLRFMEDPANRGEAITLGLIRNDSLPSQDGLGEHVTMTPAPDPSKATE